MRIAQVAPLWEQVPPPAYGGVELVVSLLTEELVRRGHEVTLFASGDSSSFAKIESVHSQALRLDPTVKEPSVYETRICKVVCVKRGILQWKPAFKFNSKAI